MFALLAIKFLIKLKCCQTLHSASSFHSTVQLGVPIFGGSQKQQADTTQGYQIYVLCGDMGTCNLPLVTLRQSLWTLVRVLPFYDVRLFFAGFFLCMLPLNDGLGIMGPQSSQSMYINYSFKLYIEV